MAQLSFTLLRSSVNQPMPPKPQPPDAASDSEQQFEQKLLEVEQSLLQLKARYAQVQLDQQRQQELQHRREDVYDRLKKTRSQSIRQDLKAELKQINEQLEALELALESQLFSWSGVKEVFWQALRFGGLGVVLGWILRSLHG